MEDVWKIVVEVKKNIGKNIHQQIRPLFLEWLEYLSKKKRYSAHTVSSYALDLETFFNYFSSISTTSDLLALDIGNFRLYISHIKKKGLENTSLARHISSVKNFFDFLKRIHNHSSYEKDMLKLYSFFIIRSIVLQLTKEWVNGILKKILRKKKRFNCN